MTQLHIFLSKCKPDIAFIIYHSKNKEKRRLNLKFIRWNLNDDSFICSDYYHSIYSCTTLRLNNCALNNDATLFICSFANYSKDVKDYSLEHWCDIFNINDFDGKHFKTSEHTSQMTSYCSTPIFIDDIIYLYPDYSPELFNLNRDKQIEPQVNLVLSGCSKEKLIPNIENITNNYLDFRGRIITTEKGKIIVNNEELINFE